MGMDVYGTNPSAEVGKYFRNNVWWWHPLWEFCERKAPDLIPTNNFGHSNDGWGLTQRKSVLLSERLDHLLETGAVRDYATLRDAAIARMPRRPCDTCESTGVRRDAVGLEHGMPDKTWTDSDGVERTGYCNMCDGVGTRPPMEAWYEFNEENVREFAMFLKHSGGFKIW